MTSPAAGVAVSALAGVSPYRRYWIIRTAVRPVADRLRPMCPACDGWAVSTGPAATGRMRVCVGLTVAGAALLMVGLITVLVGEAMRVKSPHGWQGTVRLGETVAACGLGCGLALLAAIAAGRPGGRRSAARSLSAPRPRSQNTSRAVGRPVPAAGPAACPSPGTVSGPAAARSGHTGRAQDRRAPDPRAPDRRAPARRGLDRRAPDPRALDRRAPDRRAPDRAALDQRPPGYTWDGGSQDAWRRDSADDWLSPLRNSAAVHAPEPSRWSGGPIQEFSPALDYADDGWCTESVAGFTGGSRPPQPPSRQPCGGAHRATGGTDPEVAPSLLSAGPAAGTATIADTAPLTVIMASARHGAPLRRLSRQLGNRALHQQGVDPAAVLVADRRERACDGEPERLMQRR